ncbi:MAG TPA: N-formylglutamate amidohydrolase [Aestuariivirgaceae bacterium]|jgi:N-formylglutamate amidohydrolase
MHNPADYFVPPFSILGPERQTAAAVLNSPHSGSHYPEQFLSMSRLTTAALRRSEDCYVDELFASAIDAGAPLLRATFPRAFIDLNREPNELDPHLIEGPLPRSANASSVRVVGGLGTIPRVVSEGEEIYRRKISLTDAVTRIAQLYEPYHAALARLVSATQSAFGVALLIDCHSMPSSAATSPTSTSPQPDVVIGDRHGISCSSALVERIEQLFRQNGLKVQRNRPYAGGFITERYGKPSKGLHAVQIELNRATYMNERTLVKHSGFAKLKLINSRVLHALLPDVHTLISPLPAAAE